MFIEPDQAAMTAFFRDPPAGPIVMLNLLRFREVADYRAAPELAPATPISGAEAYARYVEHSRPFVEEAGGRVLFHGAATGHGYLIGPRDEHWDAVLLIEQPTAEVFLTFASNAAYLAGLGHRQAAVSDSRLLPLQVGAR
jgi:uncharacterized protein (DUF1330 family)